MAGDGLAGVIGPQQLRAVHGGDRAVGQPSANAVGLGPTCFGEWWVDPIASNRGQRIRPLLLSMTDEVQGSCLRLVGQECAVDGRRGPYVRRRHSCIIASRRRLEGVQRTICSPVGVAASGYRPSINALSALFTASGASCCTQCPAPSTMVVPR